jgi:hypothetical protein
VTAVVFAHDGRHLASGSTDTSALVWDMAELAGARPFGPLTEEHCRTLGEALAGGDAAKAHAAIWQLSADPKGAIRWLRKELRPVPKPDADRIVRLLAALDDDSFTKREEASRELATLGEVVEVELRRHLAVSASAEARRRARELLDKFTRTDTPGRLWALRTTAVVEHLDTREAHELLEELAKGAPAAWLTQEAKASLERLRRRAVAAIGKT